MHQTQLFWADWRQSWRESDKLSYRAVTGRWPTSREYFRQAGFGPCDKQMLRSSACVSDRLRHAFTPAFCEEANFLFIVDP
jgi:hypothetical protein